MDAGFSVNKCPLTLIAPDGQRCDLERIIMGVAWAEEQNHALVVVAQEVAVSPTGKRRLWILDEARLPRMQDFFLEIHGAGVKWKIKDGYYQNEQWADMLNYEYSTWATSTKKRGVYLSRTPYLHVTELISALDQGVSLFQGQVSPDCSLTAKALSSLVSSRQGLLQKIGKTPILLALALSLHALNFYPPPAVRITPQDNERKSSGLLCLKVFQK